ncbi:hypothetical protein J2Z19_003266 [Ensifer adhaerens]|uniref:Uncharacterized protein n=1 Tax=Ensifer adhaerens TaxID=106592 RepID=A0ACC5SY16_ENSAD|nr:hypothetical protein [Ensifer adhaerens]MBP1873551.1 hypothetical protein [Ensifer adhaerens]
MSQKHIDIEPAVAYTEQAQEVAYLRNRNLVLAQQLSNANAQIEALSAELVGLRQPAADDEPSQPATIEG